MIGKYLILDDVRNSEQCYLITGKNVFLQNDFEYVKTYDEFVEYILNNPMPAFIAFDHDLADEHYLNGINHNWRGFNYEIAQEKTGYHAAMWFLDYCIENDIVMPTCIAHSQNPYGREKINSVFIQYNKYIKNKK